ncbi:MAG: hypothetical protein WC497_02650 [Patescibacteria group bacterium]
MKRILLAALLFPVIVFGCTLQKNENQNSNQATTNKTSLNSEKASYTEGEYFTFKYPVGWKIFPSETGDFVQLDSSEKTSIENNAAASACEVILTVQPNDEKLTVNDWIIKHTNIQNELSRQDVTVSGKPAVKQLIQNKGNEYKDFIVNTVFTKNNEVYYFYALIKTEDQSSQIFTACENKYNDIINSVQLRELSR